MNHLTDQLGFLRSSCKSFDEGNESEGKRIASIVRTLVHSTGRSNSLLSQLNLLGMEFLSSTHSYDESYMPSFHGLLVVELTAGADSRVKYIPPLGRGSPDRYKLEQFECWWSEIVLVGLDTRKFTRRDIVLLAANKDGGAHVDSNIDSDYRKISKENGLGWKAFTNGRSMDLNPPELVSLRQIGFEVLQSIENVLPSITTS